MSDIGMPKQWTEEQWSRVQQVVHDEARRARVAARFLPLYGPFSPDTTTVPRQLVEEKKPGENRTTTTDAEKLLNITESKTLPLTTVSINLAFTTTQQAQPDLNSALTLFARAANIIARTEDAIIFQGDYTGVHPDVDVSPKPPEDDHLLASTTRVTIAKTRGKIKGSELVTKIAEGIGLLDSQGYLPPYALALGQELFVAAETPSSDSGLVLPSDRIRPLIEGPLLRTGSLPKDKGVLVSLAAKPVEIVVASDIHVRFLQVTLQPRYVYRVSQRFVLRIKEPNAIVALDTKTVTPKKKA
jgi:uncharacterized linocin/CFP29 family protein